ncbi:MAG TPA: lysophospholipid acyltransferase family protein [Bacillota bacterium]|nr:lysophospholipid acyltransferase family protein [Bacillota bacterium]HOH09627.1 lysophospholipid acyltransferase family protein [Bacillota bacterium]HOS50708.1 lysophospholipid acyltransferase family protein [Bacillota bacterium]HQJ24259.1 lysophospholipid acyltransferase family protein [Bacillota bacterium]
MKALIGAVITYLAKSIFPIYTRLFGRLRKGRVDMAGVRPPFFLVSNHQTEMDPLYIGTSVPGRISFVATDSLFRSPTMDYLMSALGSIPKSKFKVDPSTIRMMFDSIKHGWSVGLFPEGQRSMAGYTDVIAPTVGRLAKMLDVPLVVAKLQGGFLSHPCWAYWPRRGRCVLNMKLLFSREQVRELEPEEIQEAVANSLYNSDFDWIGSQPKLRYKGKKRAQGLHNIMFACPECGQSDCFLTEGDLSTCKKCGYSVKWGDRGEFILMNGSKLHHANLEQQDKWQKEMIGQVADRAAKNPGCDTIYGPCRVTIRRKHKSEPLEVIGDDDIVLYEDAIRTSHAGSCPSVFRIDHIDGFSVEGIRGRRNRIVEFLHDGTVYSFVFHNELESTYKWHLMVRRLKTVNDGRIKSEGGTEDGSSMSVSRGYCREGQAIRE